MPRRQRLRRGVRQAAPVSRDAAGVDLGGLVRATSWRWTCCALRREPAALDAYLGELGEAAGADARLDAFCAALRVQLADGEAIELRARSIVEAMALALQGALLVRHAPAAVADAFCASRLDGGGLQHGTLPAGIDGGAIVRRHRPPAG